MPYLTPDAGTTSALRTLVVPAQFLPHVRGALDYLTRESAWREYGDMTPAECAEAIEEAMMSFQSMLGIVLPYASTACPDQMLPCDGSSYNRVDYPELYAVLDDAFIVDPDTFLVPDLTDRVVLGAGEAAPGDVGGEATHTLTVDELPSHAHEYDKTVVEDSVVLGALPGVQLGAYEATSTTAVGIGDAHENRPPFLVLRYGIVCR